VTRPLKTGIVEPEEMTVEAQPSYTKSVQTLNADTLSLNMFNIVTVVFQHIMTELNGAKSEDGRIVAITTIVLKVMKQNGC
jgi:hypothetical protein